VVLAFLRSGRGTLVTVTAIPTSLLIGLAAMHVLGFSINVLTMLALILVIGIVIDDAIVVLERCYLHLEQGAEPEPAARVGTTEMAFPAIANTMALAAVFIPVAFAGGLVGRFFLEFGLTVAVTVFASTFVALTLTPMLCSRVLRLPEHRSRLFDLSERGWQRVEGAYAWLLGAAFRRRGLTVLVGAVAFGLGLLALLQIPQEFAGQEDRSSFMLIFETPQGATLRETDRLARQIEAVLAETPEVRHQFLAIGLSQAGPGQPNRGLAFVRLTPRRERDRHQAEVMQTLRQRFDRLPQGRVFVVDLTPGGIGGAPVEIVLKHHDLDALARQQEAVMAWMRAQPEWYVGVRTNLELNAPQVDVTLDRDRAAEMGISLTDVSTAMRFLFGTPAISKVEQAAQRYDVVTDVVGRGRLAPAVLAEFYLRNTAGDLVALDNLVTLEETIGPSAIHRFNRVRAATISSNTPPGVVLGDAVARLEEHLRRTLPPGAEYELGGQSQLFAESFYYLSLVIVFAVVFIYLVLAAQFESFIHPFTIMTALPLATVGAFGSMWLLGLTLNVFAFIGLIMLVGLVTKNAILLIDYTNVLVARGLSPMAAAQEAGRARFRPVLMTAISTVLGLTPLALGLGAGGEARMPLGVAVGSGLLASTALTLVVIPVVYTLFDRLQAALLRGRRPA
jgi:multidrug efflux pump